MATHTTAAVGCAGSQHAVTAISFLGGQPSISLVGPTRRTTPENSVPFNCTAGPFSSSDFNVTWMKDRDEHPASAQRLVTDNKGNYSVTSKVWVTLSRQDILSVMTCEVTHRALAEPLRRSMNLSRVLQGARAGGWVGAWLSWQHWLSQCFTQSPISQLGNWISASQCLIPGSVQFSSVQSLSRVRLFATP